jgi:Ca2+-binding EF-hand superfamily protein
MGLGRASLQGHGSSMPSWNMNEMDANQDRTLSFEEYRDSQTKQLRAGFDMIDSNKDGSISEDEWNTFLNVHGVKVE